MRLTKKIQIHPESEVKDVLWSVSFLCKDLWNASLEQRQDKKAWGHVNVYSQKRELTEIKKQFPEFKAPSSQVLQNVIFSLDSGYKMFFTKLKNGDKDVRPPKFKSFKKFFTQEYSQRDVSFTIEDGVLGLAYGKNPGEWMKIAIPDGGYDTVKTVKICYDEKKKIWWACMTYDVAEEAPRTDGHTVYFDPGCKTALTGIKTDGTFVEYDISPIREINMETLKFIDGLMSQRDKKRKGSNRRRRLDARIRKAWNKIETRTKMYLHTVANKILTDHTDVKAFKIGDWKKQETLADTGFESVNRSINRAVQNNNPLRKLIELLTYKAKILGQEVSDFDERGTTRNCVMCEHVHVKGISPSVRTFKCEKCDFTFPRDLHSTLNFSKKYEAALWQRLRGNLPSSSTRTSFGAFSCKPQAKVVRLRLAS